jgi:glyoxylase-like metal-dependent hydrolase (beta-lactamase superfamily II)
MEVANELMVRGIVVGVFQENCWVIGSRRTGEGLCIDPGDQPEEILALARDMGVRITLIVNSHAHIDHILGVRGVKGTTGAPFLLHPSDNQLAAEGWKSAGRMLGITTEPPPAPDAALADDDVVEAGGVRLQVIHTPGHTQGSVSFYCEEAGALFSGDTLFQGSIGRTDLPGGDYDQEMDSIIRRLLVLPDETVVLPGHMLQTTIGRERQTNPFVLQELDRLRRD